MSEYQALNISLILSLAGALLAAFVLVAQYKREVHIDGNDDLKRKWGRFLLGLGLLATVMVAATAFKDYFKGNTELNTKIRMAYADSLKGLRTDSVAALRYDSLRIKSDSLNLKTKSTLDSVRLILQSQTETFQQVIGAHGYPKLIMDVTLFGYKQYKVSFSVKNTFNYPFHQVRIKKLENKDLDNFNVLFNSDLQENNLMVNLDKLQYSFKEFPAVELGSLTSEHSFSTYPDFNKNDSYDIEVHVQWTRGNYKIVTRLIPIGADSLGLSTLRKENQSGHYVDLNKSNKFIEVIPSRHTKLKAITPGPDFFSDFKRF